MISVEEELDALFRGPATSFVAGRNALAKALKAEGRRDEAAAIGKLERPTPVAWVVNQLHFDAVGATLLSTEAWTVDAEARLIVSFSNHRDDHVIRQKLGTADSTGVGGALIVEPAFIFGERVQTRLGVHAEVQYVAGGGTLHQHYYGDDPSLADDQSGTSIPDSNFSFTSLRARLLAFAGLRF